MDVENDFLTGSIRDELPYTEVIRHAGAVEELPAVDVGDGFSAHARASRRCSREPLYRRYDAVVRGCTVLPRGAADAGVLAPIPGSRLGVALAVAGNPRYGRIDPGYAAEHAVVEAMCARRRGRRATDRPDQLLELRQSAQARPVRRIRGSRRRARARRRRGSICRSSPATSASTTRRSDGSAVPASAIVACVGALDDVGARRDCPGSKSRDRRCSGSAAASWSSADRCLPSCSESRGRCRQMSFGAERTAVGILHDAIARGVLRSCRAIRDGGMLTALARLCFRCDAARPNASAPRSTSAIRSARPAASSAK